MRFQGRVAVVTGAAKGIGKAICKGFLEEGAKVVMVDIEEKALEATRKEMSFFQDRTIALTCDVSRYDQVEKVAREVLGKFGKIDVLVNNAGIIKRGTIETVSEEDWDKVVAVNLKGAFNWCKAVVGSMKAQKSGAIVNLSSIAGKMGDITSAPGYASSKAGVDALTKGLARFLAPFGVRVNGVAPHAIETEMSAQWSEERRREVISSIPLGRMGKPEEVARVVLFLASDEASFVTGEIVDVNGGALMD